MAADSLRLFTIAPDQPFLDVLADAVLAGFPLDGHPPTPLELPRWTILLPTRRAVRELERIFFARTGGKGLLLPRIRPIGDIDEDLLQPDSPVAGELPEAMPATGQLLLLIDLIDGWAGANPQTRLAREIAGAPHQAYALAASLKDFLDGLETEEIDASLIPELYGIESAHHREAILEFLSIARERYPQHLAEAERVSAACRRSMVLRQEAKRLSESRTPAPIIAAGSTGTIPATRDLLKAIAGLPGGAVVLPGLDLPLDDAGWEAVGPQHPQHALKQLLGALGVPRHLVAPLGGQGARAWLASELMRPAETSDRWRETIAAGAQSISEAMAGVELVPTAHRQQEAETIALILRHALETPGKTASLITPDRTLARRVKAELLRWNIVIDDSGGEPLLRFGGASLLHLLIDLVLDGFGAAALANLLRHEMCRIGRGAAEARHAVSVIELAALRGPVGRFDVTSLASRMRTAMNGDRPHLILQRLSAEDWEQAIGFAGDVAEILRPLTEDAGAALEDHLGRLVQAAEGLAGGLLWDGEVGEALAAAIEELRRESHRLRTCDFPRAAAILRHALRGVALRPRNPRASRLAILGLLEARLIPADLVVLGGLNEGVWPGLPDSGPWLNRPMRDRLAMQQPERAIGQTAHDFVQAFGNAEVKLVWTRRIDDAPAIPSRWILRLLMILKASGIEPRTEWPQLAAALSEPAKVTPHGKPRPCPPVAARPRQLSVTRIEKLLRDPYAIYARHILRLEPVSPVAALADASVKGLVVHNAIADFLNAFGSALPEDALQQLTGFGRKHFDALQAGPEIESFWWPRFERIAAWFVEEERRNRAGIERILAEQPGRLVLAVAGRDFALTCRADRIDILTGGTARVIDYKTGSVPTAKQVRSGLAPQLTLQAAILAGGGFEAAGLRDASAIAYVRLGGGDPAGEDKTPKLDGSIAAIARLHLSKLADLLAAYSRAEQPYLPRTVMEHEDDEGDYDHLSRFREWVLAGQAK